MIEFRVKLDFHDKEVREALRIALRNTLLECGVRASNRAKMLVPVRTGRLKASIGPTAVLPPADESYIQLGRMKTVKRIVNGKERKIRVRGVKQIKWTPEDFIRLGAYQEEGDLRASIIIGTNVKYAPHVEFGTYKNDPHPYLDPARQAEAKKMKTYLHSIFGKYFEAEFKRLIIGR